MRSAGRVLLRTPEAYPGLLAPEQPSDVLVMAQPDDDREEQREPGGLVIGEEPGGDRRCGHGDQRRQRRVPEQQGHEQPDRAGYHADLPGDGQEDAQRRRHALPALELQPDREQMAEERAGTGKDRRVGSKEMPRD